MAGAGLMGKHGIGMFVAGALTKLRTGDGLWVDSIEADRAVLTLCSLT